MSLAAHLRLHLPRLLVVAVLAAAFVAKGARYLAEPPLLAAPALAEVRLIMQQHGWNADAIDIFPVGMPLTAATFTRVDCPHPVTIALLGDKPELQRYVRLLYRDDVAFVQNGRLLSQPTADARSLARLARMAAYFAPGPRAQLLPILAITPAPSGDTCSAPGDNAWTSG